MQMSMAARHRELVWQRYFHKSPLSSYRPGRHYNKIRPIAPATARPHVPETSPWRQWFASVNKSYPHGHREKKNVLWDKTTTAGTFGAADEKFWDYFSLVREN